jgi:hypothetical protein
MSLLLLYGLLRDGRAQLALCPTHPGFEQHLTLWSLNLMSLADVPVTTVSVNDVPSATVTVGDIQL